jgi:hypothetical protein
VNNWNLMIIIGCSLLGIILIRKEFSRKNKHWRLVRCIATLLAVFGLGGMVFQIKNSNGDPNLAVIKKQPDSLTSIGKAGISDIHWKAVLKSGELLMIEGRYVNPDPRAKTLVLSGFDARLDSVIIPSGGEYPFRLRTIPKQTGKAIFELQVIQGGQILETEPMPVVVEPQDPLNVLMLASYPDFENKFLSQWLTGNHIQVVQRTRISQHKYEKIFLNRPPFDFNQITDSLLSPFDLLICDLATLASLTSAEQSAIRHQLSQNGMGLMIRADTIPDKKGYYDDQFPCYSFKPKNNSPRLLYTTDSLRNLPYPDAAEAIGIRFQSGTQPLLFEKGGEIRVSSVIEGRGRICFSTIHNSFEWSLGGRAEDYGYYWTWLIQKTAKRKKENFQWWTAEKFPRQHQPAHFSFESGDGHMPGVRIGSDSLFLRQHKNYAVLWEGEYWPRQSGWQPAVHTANRYMDWYVFEDKDWPLFFIPQFNVPLENQGMDTRKNAWIFCIILISGWCFLWLERKFFLI